MELDVPSEAEIEVIVRRVLKEALESELPRIAELGAKRAIEIMAAEVGTSVIKKLLWAIGIGVLGLLGWLGIHGALPSG